MATRIAVCISGRGSNLAALLDALQDQPDAAVVLVLSNNAAAAGLDLARAAGVPAEVLDDPANPTEWSTRLGRREVDLVVLAGFLKLVPQQTVAEYRGRIINIHPALLPRFGGKGMYGLRVHRAVIEAGESHSGATVHLVDEEYDRGQILAQAKVPVEPGDTPERLAARVLELEHRLLPEVVLTAARVGHPVPLPDTEESTH